MTSSCKESQESWSQVLIKRLLCDPGERDCYMRVETILFRAIFSDCRTELGT